MLERLFGQVEQDVCLLRRATLTEKVHIQRQIQHHRQPRGKVPDLPHLAVGEDHPLHTLTDTRVAAYVAKYATKAAECTGTLDHRIVPTDQLTELPVSEHARRLIGACLRLGKLSGLEDLRLAPWAHMLGFRGHFSTKSRHYSTTFSALRAERAQHQRDHAPTESLWPEPNDDTTLVVTNWRFAGRARSPIIRLSGDAIRSGAPPPSQPEGGQP